MFADRTTDFILVIFDYYSLLIGVVTIALRNFRHAGPSKMNKEDSPFGDFYRSTGSTNKHTWQTPKNITNTIFSESSICWLQ